MRHAATETSQEATSGEYGSWKWIVTRETASHWKSLSEPTQHFTATEAPSQGAGAISYIAEMVKMKTVEP